MKRFELRRYSSQGDAILRRLKQGPATNRELAAIALKYTSRVSDLRKIGHQIRARVLPRGKTVYYLED